MTPYQPIVEVTRGPLVESIHFGALAVVDVRGNLIASVGDPDLVANLRSSAKPFQALSMVEAGAADAFHFTERELAISCASHSGTDDHYQVLCELQAKIGVGEEDLRCGVHYPMYEPLAYEMRQRGQKPTPNRHNCSGKHTAMLANARYRGFPIEDYLNTEHPVQKVILKTFAEMVGLPPDAIPIGIDGCSAPTFATPLRRAAHAYALLADPSGLPEPRRSALRRIYQAMTAHPDMVAGPERFDTLLMQAANGKVVAKGGAEAYQGMGVAAGVLGPGSPALGIAIKVSDGDRADRAISTAAFAVLAQLGILTADERAHLARYDRRSLTNWRELEVGEIRPAFDLDALVI